jgi:hypothetical protein
MRKPFGSVIQSFSPLPVEFLAFSTVSMPVDPFMILSAYGHS